MAEEPVFQCGDYPDRGSIANRVSATPTRESRGETEVGWETQPKRKTQTEVQVKALIRGGQAGAWETIGFKAGALKPFFCETSFLRNQFFAKPVFCETSYGETKLEIFVFWCNLACI